VNRVQVLNVHERVLHAPVERVWALLDTLASRHDVIWPVQSWPPMELDSGLRMGARGGHGPIRYSVESYALGRKVRFRFEAPAGFDGWHEFSIASVPECPDRTILTHKIEMTVRGIACISWPLLFRPLHDALIEDAFANVEHALDMPPRIVVWSPWVRALRFAMSRGKSRRSMHRVTLRAADK